MIPQEGKQDRPAEYYSNKGEKMIEQSVREILCNLHGLIFDGNCDGCKRRIKCDQATVKICGLLEKEKYPLMILENGKLKQSEQEKERYKELQSMNAKT